MLGPEGGTCIVCRSRQRSQERQYGQKYRHENLGMLKNGKRFFHIGPKNNRGVRSEATF